MSELDLARLREYLREFAAERDWEQFHTPKNLAMALAGETGELLEIFQWLTPEESASLTEDQKHAAADEIVDVLQYLVRLADLLDIDLDAATWRKLADNARRYAATEVRGSAAKQ